jgi:UDP-N-acetylmuramoyl-tripeptide--D-alanyl-D-alanine ligase
MRFFLFNNLLMMTIENIYSIFLNNKIITTDSRQITPGCIFFALKGPSFNGNSFAQQAIEKGAAFAIIDEPQHPNSDKYILVKDVLLTLQELAQFHRRKLNIPIIAITGTNGKTTTKELTYAVLQEKYKVIATQGNLNNHIGVPITLLGLTNDTEIGIIEMGANHPREIELLCSIAEPNYGNQHWQSTP